MVTGTTTDCDNLSNHGTDDNTMNSADNTTTISNNESIEQQKDQQLVKTERNSTSSITHKIETASKSSDYENLQQFNNLNENESKRMSFIEKINSKNIEVASSVSSPSSAVMSEENNDAVRVVIDLMDSKGKVENKENIQEISTKAINENFCTNTAVDTDVDNHIIDDHTSIEIEKDQNSNANSKFCLIKEDEESSRMNNNNNNKQLFNNSKTSVFLKERNKKSIFNANAATINKLLLFLFIFSIGLFAASVCYIIIAHLTQSFTIPGFGFFKSEPFVLQMNANNMNTTSDQTITVETSTFGNLTNGEEVKRYVLRNKNGFEVALLSFGATIQSIKTLDKSGNLLNVVIGLNTIEEYTDSTYNKHFGGIIGRTSNRTSNAEFTLDGAKYSLEKNNGVNNLHGGSTGFDMRNWNSTIDGDSVKFTIFSPDGEGGYPGDVNVEVTYRIDKYQHTLYIDYKGNTSKSTPLDLTNHAYFNLNGRESLSKIYNHEIKIFADNYLVSNSNDLITTGEIKSVLNTKYDLRDYTKLSDRIKANAAWPEEGYDNYFVVNQQSGKKYAASVRNPSNGLVLDIFSDQNGIQFYTANFLNVTTSSSNEKFDIHEAFVLNLTIFLTLLTSSVVRPEGEYSQRTIWSFRIEN